MGIIEYREWDWKENRTEIIILLSSIYKPGTVLGTKENSVTRIKEKLECTRVLGINPVSPSLGRLDSFAVFFK